MAPTLILVLALICRIDRPASRRSRRTSLILRIVILFAAMVLLPGENGQQSTKCVNGQCVRRRFRSNVNAHSGMVNTDSGKSGKTFTFSRNPCSRWSGTGVHVRSEWVFTMGRNMQLCNFRWAEGEVSLLLLAIDPPAGEDQYQQPSDPAYVQRSWFNRWTVSIPSDWPESLKQECRDEVSYYLAEISDRYPPNYVVYHCGTSANQYAPLAFRLCRRKLPRWHRRGPVF